MTRRSSSVCAFDSQGDELWNVVAPPLAPWGTVPVVADVDLDGAQEVVVAANDWRRNILVNGHPTCGAEDPETGTPFEDFNNGVTVWRDVQDRWAPSRRIWNQHAYSVTNVEEDGRIPAVPENNWSIVGLNNFRVNTRNDPASATRGVDLTVRAPAWDDACPDLITLSATVANRGIRRAPRGISVGFYLPADDGSESVVCQTRTLVDIAPGETETVTCDWLSPPREADIHVWVDDTDALVECEEENNDATITDVGCDIIK